MDKLEILEPSLPLKMGNPQITKKFVIPSINELITDNPNIQFQEIPKNRYQKKRIQKGSWSEEEDELLFSTVSELRSLDWKLIAKKIKTHTPKQCCERWFVKLNPNIRRTPFERWEDELILYERQKIGNRWSVISQLLPGRTSCSVKNRWYTVLRYRCQNTNSCTYQQNFPSVINSNQDNKKVI